VTKSSGNFGHVLIETNKPMQLELNGLGKQALVFEELGVKVELEAEKFECALCMAENALEGEEMKLTSLFANLKYSSVVIAGILGAKCQVKSAAGTGVIESESMKIVTTSTGSVTFAPATGTTLASFEIVPVTGKVCNLKGNYTLNGAWVVAPSGATWTTNVGFAESPLTVNGNPASLKGEATAEGLVTPTAENPKPGSHAIAFT